MSRPVTKSESAPPGKRNGGLRLRFLLLFAIATALGLLCGCKVGPDYQRPAPMGTNALPPAFAGVSNATLWKAAEPAAHLPRGAWWQVFRDAQLDGLEDLAAANNQELAGAAARFAEARASLGVARADLLPQIQLDANYVRQRTSYNQPTSGHAAGASPTYNTFTTALQAGWEVDLWGRVRRQVETARAQLAASADDLEGVKLALSAELAAD